MNVLLLDNYDSFTYMLKDYIEQNGAKCHVIRNDSPDMAHLTGSLLFDKIVISPGPCAPKDAGSLMEHLPAIIQNHQVLGVCLGHQALGEYFGARLIKASVPKHGKTDRIHHKENPLFSNIPQVFDATRYHSLVIDEIPVELEVIASSATGEVMGIAHKTLPLWGIQFHPESCMTLHGKQIIENFLLLSKQKR